jgi:hypothetical protein
MDEQISRAILFSLHLLGGGDFRSKFAFFLHIHSYKSFRNDEIPHNTLYLVTAIKVKEFLVFNNSYKNSNEYK